METTARHSAPQRATARHSAPQKTGAKKAMKTGARAMIGGNLRKKSAGSTQIKPKDVIDVDEQLKFSELVESMQHKPQELACNGTQLDEDTAMVLEDAVDDDLPKNNAGSMQIKPKLKLKFSELVESMQHKPQELACNETQLDEDTATELEDAVDDDLPKKNAESAELKPKKVDLTKKIAASTQLKPEDVKSVLSALHTVAYRHLKRQTRFLMPGVHLEARKMRQEHGCCVITGNFKVVMASLKD